MAPPTRPATPLASSEASGSSTSRAAMASTPSRSLSSSRPAAAAEQVAHRPGGEQAERGAVGAEHDAVAGELDGDVGAARAGGEEDEQRDQAAVAALEQPAEQRDRADGHDLVAGRAVVREQRRERAPRIVGADAVVEVRAVEQAGVDARS